MRLWLCNSAYYAACAASAGRCGRGRPRAAAIAGLVEIFDAPWYLERYSDVAAACIEPLQHYIRHGRPEGRPTFRSLLAGVRTTPPTIEVAADARDAGFSLHVPDEILLRINEAVLRRGTRV